MTEKAINILGIESSCDETAAAVVRNGREVLSNVVSTQILVHRKFGGVVPEIASRKHIEHVMPVIHKALTDAAMTLQDVDAIAVTYGPGLVGALLVGLSAAKGLALGSGKPLIGVNHLEGHVFANFLADPDLQPPFLALVVSGGHTSLLVVEDYNTFRLLGQTRDDAAGEAFDKIARFMGLPYPGGPEIERLAQTGDPASVDFPRPLLSGCFDFSFSGLKSAVINYLHTEEQRKNGFRREDAAASFQQAIVDVLVKRSQEAIRATGLKKIVLAGGVSANRRLQEALAKGAREAGAELVHPTPILCTDNAVMIGVRGYYQYLNHDFASLDLNADPSLKLGE
ncbi:tRNA (adenosine(37)-N6)-threonylcarbamoyltransferase complex transferase subunit TsaD [Acidaminococcus sp. LBK-2]|uniref:tRNA (adenosine(37)-N6)-threonylcarbamoyltransferase complex transferase subunit TsaD n=1 Tax=Acidaminococcus sp. LBK-2 TaxID=3456956 RepID=UPI003FA49967